MTPPKDDGGPAFPSQITAEDRNGTPIVTVFKGMTLRDYFASKAPGLPSQLAEWALEAADVTNPDKSDREKSKVILNIVAEWNYMYADAMLAARKGGAK